MAAASAIEIKRAADQARAANELEALRQQIQRIEAKLDALLAERPARGRAA